MNGLDSILFAPGVRNCLHLASGRDARDLCGELKLSCGVREGDICVAAIPRQAATIWTRLFGPPTTSEWLAAKLGCSESEAKARIQELPVPVLEKFSGNAYNPLRFLGFVVAAVSDPSILIYETSGMDPKGRKLLHEYASEVYTVGTLIHASSVPINQCEFPSDCKCIEL